MWDCICLEAASLLLSFYSKLERGGDSTSVSLLPPPPPSPPASPSPPSLLPSSSRKAEAIPEVPSDSLIGWNYFTGSSLAVRKAWKASTGDLHHPDSYSYNSGYSLSNMQELFDLDSGRLFMFSCFSLLVKASKGKVVGNQHWLIELTVSV